MSNPKDVRHVWYMEAKELRQRLERNERVQILDCRFWLDQPAKGHEAYLSGHIPHALYVDLDRDLSSPRKEHGGRHPLPDPEHMAHTLTSLGIGKQDTVVAYDEQGGAMASRLLWLLQWIGHEGHVYVLDGGYNAWCKEEFPLEAGEAQQRIAVESPYQTVVQTHMVADVHEVRSKLGDTRVRLVDSREHVRYIGEMEPIDPQAGHIPGARNRFWKDGLNEQGLVRTVQEEMAAWNEQIGEAEEIIVYCGSGVTACPNVLSLWRAGYQNVKLYAGSWSDWCSYEENPIAIGEE